MRKYRLRAGDLQVEQMKLFYLLAWYREWHAVLGIYSTVKLAQRAAEQHTPQGRVFWKPELTSPDDDPHGYSGILDQPPFKFGDFEIVQWSVFPCELNVFWVKDKR